MLNPLLNMNQVEQEEISTPPNGSLCSALLTGCAEKAQAGVINCQSSIYFARTSKRRRRHTRWFLAGVFVVVALSAAVLIRYFPESPLRCWTGRWISCFVNVITQHLSSLLPRKANGILNYLRLFQLSNHSPSISPEAPQLNRSIGGRHNTRSRQLLGGSDANGFRYPQLVVAGKMTVEDGPCNIAQYNLKTHAWSLTERIQLSLYNSYSGGEVYSLLANHTFLPMVDSEDGDDDSSRR